ncbi:MULTISPECIES: AMP-binding enzyme [Streptomyces]|uniref:AMP-binding enzyme C-terminal domain-containing protein n=1 Tax=Streptomyces ortus TaxID=2867268 RepID=A0ABT3UVF1_9ACTN|nr:MULTISPECIES: hypothetical protein [Streptomyces]MCX4231533.1 hypothetical protein [Streptomyces ortus]
MYYPLTVRDFLDRAAHVYPDRVGVGSDGEVLTASNHNLDDEGYLVISDRKAEELTAHCRTRLAGFTTPERIDFVAALPRTATGKLQKFKLREPFRRE